MEQGTLAIHGWPSLNYPMSREGRGRARTKQISGPRAGYSLSVPLASAAVCLLRPWEGRGHAGREGRGSGPGLPRAFPSGEGDTEAKHQPRCDRYPQMNLSHGVFENFHYTGCSGISGGV